MSYTIKAGIDELELAGWLTTAAKKYGYFDDGRVNFTKAPIAPIVMCTILHSDKILLAKRGEGLADAEGYWSTINGFIDEPKPVRAFVIQEVKEELGIKVVNDDIRIGSSYTLHNPQEKRRYIVFPCLVILDKKPAIKLNPEHTTYRWINIKDLQKYHILDDLPYAVNQALELTEAA